MQFSRPGDYSSHLLRNNSAINTETTCSLHSRSGFSSGFQRSADQGTLHLPTVIARPPLSQAVPSWLSPLVEHLG